MDKIAVFKELVESASKILVTSHISPDPDAIASGLLMGQALAQNYPSKQVLIVIEEEPIGLDTVPGYKLIRFGSVAEQIKTLRPDLVVLLDANNFSRVSRNSADDISADLKQIGAKVAIIDHHEPDGKEEGALYINQGSPATAQDVYEICFDKLHLQKPAGGAQLAMLGIYSDSGGFAYHNDRHSDTLRLADRLIAEGANIESVVNLTNQYSQNDMLVLAELARNISSDDDYTYSYISDEFVKSWLDDGKTGSQLHKGTEAFVNNFIRNVEGRLWGFIVYKNVLQGDNVYSASFRSVGTAKDVSKIASALGGGGHKPAAGAKFEAHTLGEALAKVKQVIVSA